MLFTDVSSERAVKALEKAGFKIIRNKGKHIVMAKDEDMVTVPRHKRLNSFTLKAIIQDAGLTDQEFSDLL